MNNKIWWIIGAILLLIYVSQDTTKKEFNLTATNTTMVVVGAIILIVAFTTFNPFAAVGVLVANPYVLISIAAVIFGLFSMFRKATVIPTWVYIAGFLVLLFMVLKKK